MAANCPRCGSDRIIPKVPMPDHIGVGISAVRARVEVLGNPHAFIFTDKAVGELSLNICGDCGHAELFVKGARALWDKYEHSLQS